MKQTTMRIDTSVGLHARPAALFVQQTSAFSSKISIRNKTTDSGWVNAKSILAVLTLGVETQHEIDLKAEGLDEEQAISTLTALVASGLGEKSADL